MAHLEAIQGPHNRVMHPITKSTRAQWTLRMSDGTTHRVFSLTEADGTARVRLDTPSGRSIGGNKTFESVDEGLTTIGYFLSVCEHGKRGTDPNRCPGCEAEYDAQEAWETDMDRLTEQANDRWASEEAARIPASAR